MSFGQYNIISIHSQSFASGSGKNLEKCQFLESCLLSITNSAGQRCWDIYHDFGGTYNKVFKCSGDKSVTSSLATYYDGTERFFVQINHTTTTAININVYGEFSPLEAAGNQGPASAALQASCNATGTMQLFFWGTPNNFEMVHSQSAQIGGNDCIIAGQCDWKCITKAHRGIAFTSGSIATGTNITISVDRDMRDGYANRWGGFAVSGIVHIWPVSPTGSALNGTGSNIAKIVSVGPSSIVVDRVINSITGAAMIGEMGRRLIRNNNSINGGQTSNFAGGTGSSTNLGFVDEVHDRTFPTAPDLGEMGFPFNTGRHIWGHPHSKSTTGAGTEGFFGYAPIIRLALSSTAGFFQQGDLWFDSWKNKYYEIFSETYGTVDSSHIMRPFTGSVSGRTIYAGKMRNYLDQVEDQQINRSGTVIPASGGTFRDVWLNDFDFPSGSIFVSSTGSGTGSATPTPTSPTVISVALRNLNIIKRKIDEMKPLEIKQYKTPEVNDLQNAVRRWTSQFDDIPLLEHKIIEDISVSSLNQIYTIRHQLGKKFKGWFEISPSGLALEKVAGGDDRQEIRFRAVSGSVPTTVNICVF